MDNPYSAQVQIVGANEEISYTASDGSSPRAMMESLAHKFVSVHDNPSLDIAREINRERLHVLLDLNGHTKGNRFDILALKPSAIQVLFHGYAGTLTPTLSQPTFIGRPCQCLGRSISVKGATKS